MKKKQIIAIALLVLGVAGFLYAVNGMKRISSAKEGVEMITSPFSDSKVGSAAGNVLKGEASKYDTQVTILLVGSIALVIIGAAILIKGRKKR